MARMLIDNHSRAIPETCLTDDQVARMDNHPSSAPRTPLEAAIDAATGYKPGDENGGTEVTPAQLETASVQQQDVGKGEKAKKWVNEAYECFIKNAVDLEPTNPKGAVWEYFKKNATDELKAKVEAEGKTGESCWKFIEEVAKKALHGRSGHIDPVAVYAIAMHYFQDVPKDWDQAEVYAKVEAKSKELDAKAAKRARKIAHKNRVKLAKELGNKEFAAKVEAEGRELDKAEAGQQANDSKAQTEKKTKDKPKAKKRGGEQGFFFDLMEMEPVVGKEDVGMEADAQGGKKAGDAE